MKRAEYYLFPFELTEDDRRVISFLLSNQHAEVHQTCMETIAKDIKVEIQNIKESVQKLLKYSDSLCGIFWRNPTKKLMEELAG